MKWVGVCQAHTAACLFAWRSVLGTGANEVREVRIVGNQLIPLYANSAGQNGFLGKIQIIMKSSIVFHCCSSFFISSLGTILQAAVFHHGAIILLATPGSCCLWRSV
jgi:hypothetical protein